MISQKGRVALISSKDVRDSCRQEESERERERERERENNHQIVTYSIFQCHDPLFGVNNLNIDTHN